MEDLEKRMQLVTKLSINFDYDPDTAQWHWFDNGETDKEIWQGPFDSFIECLTDATEIQ